MQYHTATSFENAVELAQAAKGTTRFLAGGTDVLVQLRGDFVTPDVLIDIKQIPGAAGIQWLADGSWQIGAAVSGAQLYEHEALKTEWPGLVEAMNLIGSTQVQGRATLSGNLCNGSPAADSVPAMLAADVSVTIIGPDGQRQVPVGAIPRGPGQTTLKQGEVISSVNIPAQSATGADAYLRFIPRTEMDIAVVGCAVNLSLDGPKITAAKVAIGAVAPTARAVDSAANAIVGTTLDDAALTALADAVREACDPIDDKRGTIEYRTHVAGVLAQRAAKIAYQRARSKS
ncbi:MAG: xanthine dehydrogenase family protein subunit M [Marinovum sp.]|nr:xanthine dehydrogenase family protein subunit M [Marinovum sp.]MBT7906779.1 xanthine dehydrogenase family protein subunit M [Marinovum sp.]